MIGQAVQMERTDERMSRMLFYNGTVITMEEPFCAQAVLTEEGVIRAVGTFEDVRAAAGEGEMCLVDLQGHTLMPGFIDPHSHFTACANATMQVDLGEAECFEDVIRLIREFIQREQIPAGQWVRASGYDHNRLREGRHPDRRVLDQAAPEHLLMVSHQSGHMGAFNTRALKALGVDGHTEPPQGGMIAVEGGEPTGYMEENAFLQYIQKAPMPSPEAFLEAYRKAQKLYASYGITTVQEGMMSAPLGPLYQLLLHSGILELDLVAYVDMEAGDELKRQFADHIGTYKDHMKIGGYKMFLDGSPQGRTAWLREPYLPVEGGNAGPAEGAARTKGAAPSPDCGYPTLTDAAVKSNILRAERDQMQLLAHCNGDAACEQYLREYAAALAELPDHTPGDIRPVMIHAQLLGLDQLERVKALGIIPSFFLAHVYHWGGIHLKNLGQKRAERISPAHSALEHGIRFSLHQDAPVIRPDMMETVWCAVNRLTRNGVLLGAKERISVEDALRAVTINGAYQYFEENKKGSIAPGKLADFVILERNPLEADPMELRRIRVMATIKEGKCIYRAVGQEMVEVHESHTGN